MKEEKFCLCCNRPVRIMTEADYCSAKCRRGKCGHKQEQLSLGARMGHPGGHYG